MGKRRVGVVGWGRVGGEGEEGGGIKIGLDGKINPLNFSVKK